MIDPDDDKCGSLLQGPPEIPISQEHRLELRSRVLEAYDAAGRAAAKPGLATIRHLLPRMLAAAACVALGLAIGWFVRGASVPASPAPAPGLAAGRPAETLPATAGRSGDFWSYRRLARLYVPGPASAGAAVQPRTPRSSMWDLPVEGDQR